MESYLTQALVQQAFTMACHHTQPGRGVIFHCPNPLVETPVIQTGSLLASGCFILKGLWCMNR